MSSIAILSASFRYLELCACGTLRGAVEECLFPSFTCKEKDSDEGNEDGWIVMKVKHNGSFGANAILKSQIFKF